MKRSTNRDMNPHISGKTIVITGGSSGMGAAAARHLAGQGANIVVAARRAERLETLVSEITKDGHQALAVAADVSNRGDVQNLVDTAVRKFGRIDVLVNNAGVMPLSPLERLKIEEWEQMIDVNLRGVLYGIAAALPYMKDQKSGQIINTASVAAYKIFPAAAVYCATKFAVRALSEGLRQEVKPYNVRTTIISPGAVATELLDHISDEEVRLANQAYVGKVGIPAESFARMVAFAISQPEDVDVNEIVFRPTAQDL
jgi:NADP-dependent 3-hydroxy acid dehydrogenase YdfG